MSIKVPTRVVIAKVRQVSCGNTHMLILSEDSTTVWSCGSGDGGKLGHGDTNRVLSPKVINYVCVEQNFILLCCLVL